MPSITATPTAPTEIARRPLTAERVDIVIPVYNEELALERSVRRLHRFLTDEMPYDWRIVIADNASTDTTLAIARSLQYEMDGVEAVHLDRKGRGRALFSAWSRSDADVLCYMDVDLSTDLKALLPLVSALVSGHSEVAIGTRLAPGSRVERGPKRELISRSYNRMLRLGLGAHFSDAQCGFKAIRADAARQLLPMIKDTGWFFDTELLVLAQRRGMRIHEVAVDWVDDPDSRVNIVSTALTDLRGVARLRFATPLWRFLTIAHRRRQHPGQPDVDLPDPRPRRPDPPAPGGRARVPDRARPHRRGAGPAARAGDTPVALAGGGGARRGEHAGHDDALRGPAHLGVRSRPARAGAAADRPPLTDSRGAPDAPAPR
jgi:hypothetical protein